MAVAGRGEAVARIAAAEDEPTHWAAAGHALDYDDLHLESTAHISVVCLVAALAAGGGAQAYLAGAGVMARLGAALGWEHYRRGWHATCAAGAPAAAAAAGVAFGLDAPALAHALALAVPAAGGLQRAFGTMAKPLQVGFAVSAGVRAARLVRAGANADPAAFDDWIELLGGSLRRVETDPGEPAVPGGLAIKLYPCCYALQRPIAATATMKVDPEAVEAIKVRTPEASLQPLNRHRPKTGLEAKFSLEYGMAAALLDHPVGFASFSDDCVARAQAQRLLQLVETEARPGGSGLLDGHCEIEIRTPVATRVARVDLPPGAPGRPATDDDLKAKVADCCGELAEEVLALDWPEAAAFLRRALAVRP